MTASSQTTSRLAHLDMLRGVAALLVMSGHLRAFVFQNYGALPEAQGPFVKAFYFMTGFGAHAVLAFFALSGFLVGGKALLDLREARFTWSGYLLRRLTRLWLVIVPALAATYVLDQIGVRLTGGLGYDGHFYDILSSGPKPPGGINQSFVTLVGNLAFLQTLAVPVFGSNGPMWSLANEFWYYIVFPLAAWIVLSRAKAASRLLGASILVVLAWALPGFLWAGGMVWLAGAAAGWATRTPRLAIARTHLVARLSAVAALAAMIALAKAVPSAMSPERFGFLVALILPVLASMPAPGKLYGRVSKALSEISYTLYLSHFPLLMLLAMTLIGADRLRPGAGAAAAFVAFFAVAMAWATILWWLFERRTDRLYGLIVTALGQRPRAKPPASTTPIPK